MASVLASSPPRLTEVEARVVGALLGEGPESEAERIHRSGLPRTSYQEAKRRVYARGWVYDRYLPNPGVFGHRWASFVIGQPYAEQFEALSTYLTGRPDTVVLWSSLDSFFSVSLQATPPRPGSEMLERLVGGSRHAQHLTADLFHPSVPIFFDFAGAWAHLAGGPRARHYPRPIAPTMAPPEHGPSPSTRRAAMELVLLPTRSDGAARAPHRVGPYALPRSSQRLVATGWIVRRTFPNLSLLPPVAGRRLEAVVLVTGEHLPTTHLKDLVTDLCNAGRSFPFLLASDGARALLGFLASRPVDAAADPPSPASGVLLRHLAHLDVFRLPLEHLRTPVDHRYTHLAGNGSGR